MSLHLSTKSSRLSGPEGLFTAIILRATKDALNYNDPENYIDSWAYFGSENYRQDLALLGVPEGALPEVFENMETDDFLTLCKQIRSNDGDG